MRFSPFRRNRRGDQASTPPTEPRSWHESGVGAEVEAFLTGRIVDHLVAHKTPLPVWAVVNRLAHADHDELVRLVGGDGLDRLAHPSRPVQAWAEHERFIAAHLLATSGSTPDRLDRIQREVLVPFELELIERSRVEPFDSDDVLDGAAKLLDSHHPGG